MRAAATPAARAACGTGTSAARAAAAASAFTAGATLWRVKVASSTFAAATADDENTISWLITTLANIGSTTAPVRGAVAKVRTTPRVAATVKTASLSRAFPADEYCKLFPRRDRNNSIYTPALSTRLSAGATRTESDNRKFCYTRRYVE